MKKTLIFATVALITASAQAQSLEFVKYIPIAVDAGARIKDVAADASGNLFVSQYFGSGHEIKKVTDPLGTASVSNFTSGVAYGSGNGSCMATDPAGNVYFAYGSAYDNSYVAKFKTDGTLDTTFGTGGFLPVGDGTRQVRQISYSAENGGRLVVTGWGTNPCLLVLNAATGAKIAESPGTIGDNVDRGYQGTAITTIDTWSGHYYDATAKNIYGNAQGDLVKMNVGTGLDNIAAGTQQILTYHGRNNDSAVGLAANTELGLIAYSGVVANNVASNWANNVIRFYNTGTGQDSTWFFPIKGDGKLDYYDQAAASSQTNGGAMVWLKKENDWYLVFNNMYGNCLNVYKFHATPQPQLFNYVKTIALQAETGAAVKSLAALSNGDLLFGSYYVASPIKKITDPLGAATFSNFNSTSLPSSSGNVVTVDANDNVYYSIQSATVGTGGIYKFDSAGNPVTSFGTNGISLPTLGTLTGVPHGVKAVGDRLLVSTHSTPYTMAVYNSTTGQPVANASTTFPVWKPSNETYNGSISAKTMWFDTTNNYFYGNACGNLSRWKITGGIDALPTTTLDTATAEPLAGLPGGGDMSTLSVDPTGTWIAWPAFMDKAPATAISAGGQFPYYLGLYNTGTGEVQYLYDMAAGEKVFNQGAGSTWFVKNGKTYLAVISYYKGGPTDTAGNQLRIFEYVGPKAAVADWSQF